MTDMIYSLERSLWMLCGGWSIVGQEKGVRKALPKPKRGSVFGLGFWQWN